MLLGDGKLDPQALLTATSPSSQPETNHGNTTSQKMVLQEGEFIEVFLLPYNNLYAKLQVRVSAAASGQTGITFGTIS